MNLVHIMLVIYSTIEMPTSPRLVFSSRLSHQQSSENKDRVVLAFWEYEGIITKRTNLQKEERDDIMSAGKLLLLPRFKVLRPRRLCVI